MDASLKAEEEDMGGGAPWTDGGEDVDRGDEDIVWRTMSGSGSESAVVVLALLQSVYTTGLLFFADCQKQSAKALK